MIALWIWSGKKKNEIAAEMQIPLARRAWSWVLQERDRWSSSLRIVSYITHTHTRIYVYIYIHRYILSSSSFQHIHDNPVSKLGAFGAWIILSIHVTKTTVTVGSLDRKASKGVWRTSWRIVQSRSGFFVQGMLTPKSWPQQIHWEMVEFILKPTGQEMFWFETYPVVVHSWEGDFNHTECQVMKENSSIWTTSSLRETCFEYLGA